MIHWPSVFRTGEKVAHHHLEGCTLHDVMEQSHPPPGQEAKERKEEGLGFCSGLPGRTAGDLEISHQSAPLKDGVLSSPSSTCNIWAFGKEFKVQIIAPFKGTL